MQAGPSLHGAGPPAPHRSCSLLVTLLLNPPSSSTGRHAQRAAPGTNHGILGALRCIATRCSFGLGDASFLQIVSRSCGDSPRLLEPGIQHWCTDGSFPVPLRRKVRRDCTSDRAKQGMGGAASLPCYPAYGLATGTRSGRASVLTMSTFGLHGHGGPRHSAGRRHSPATRTESFEPRVLGVRIADGSQRQERPLTGR